MYYYDGYKYWLAYRKDKTDYYRCCLYKKQCTGRLVIEDGRIRTPTQHNHSPEPDRALVDRFRKILTQRSASENLELYSIYWEEATQRHSEAALLYTFSQAESAMRKARRKQLPNTPTTIQELGDILSASDLFRIHTGTNRDQFYQTSLVHEDSTSVIFLHKKTIDLIGRVEEIQVDATYFVQPLTSLSYYIFTAHSLHSERNCPILYAITTNKNQNFFTSIFSYLREQLSNFILPNVIISEFDYNMQSTLNYIFPEANIKGNWFAYAENIMKQMKVFGLERETNKGHGASALRMMMVLPLLPAEYISPGLNALKKWMEEKLIFSQGFKSLSQHIESNWVRGIGAEKMSIFGLTNGMNNHLQNFNRELKNLININNPTIWHVLECLTTIATKNYVRLSKKIKNSNSKSISNVNQKSSSTHPKKGQIVIETIIKNATQLWIRTAVHLRNPLQFLQLCSHCIQDINNFILIDEPGSSKSCIKNVSSIPVRYVQPTIGSSMYNNNNNNSSIAPNSNNNTSSIQLVAAQNTAEVYSQNNYQQNYYQNYDNHQQNYQTNNPSQHFLLNCSNNYSKYTNTNNITQIHQAQPTQIVQQQHQQQHTQSNNQINPISVEPPPLAFFPNASKILGKRKITLTEPPPLVRIGSGRR